jgi:hypothetical protein
MQAGHGMSEGLEPLDSPGISQPAAWVVFGLPFTALAMKVCLTEAHACPYFQVHSIPSIRKDVAMKTAIKILLLAVLTGLLAAPATVATTAPVVDDPPHMQQALDALRQAERHLQAAIPDKGGHRSAAIKACQDAIKDTEEGIKYQSDHPDHK